MAEKLLLCYFMFCRQIIGGGHFSVDRWRIEHAAKFFGVRFADLWRAKDKLTKRGYLIPVEAADE